MAKLKEITVSISRKLSDDNYGSFGVQAAITLEVDEGEDKDELYAASASWLSAKVAGTHKSHGTLPSQFDPDASLEHTPKPAKPTPVPAGAVAQPTDGVVAGELTFPVESITVDIKGGKRYAKAKGGRFTMYGVNVWDEVLLLPPLEWKLQEMDGAEFPMEPGVVAIYVEKTLDGGKVVPDKVVGWK